MASVHIHITDTKGAIEDGTIPGTFSTDRTVFTFTQLEYRTQRQQISWTVKIRLFRGGHAIPITDEALSGAAIPKCRAEIIVESFVVNAAGTGKIRDIIPTYVETGKNIGKKNETTALTQAFRDALGLYNRQKKKSDLVGVMADVPSADVPTANVAADMTVDARPPPMLVQKIGSSGRARLTSEDFQEGVTVQRKLNGVRFVATAAGAESAAGAARPGSIITCYSRTGGTYQAPPAIQAELAEILQAWAVRDTALASSDATKSDALSSNATKSDALSMLYLDGELYKHGVPLNKISGQARGSAAPAEDLEYHVFDVFFPQVPGMVSRDRQRILDAILGGAPPHPHIIRVENFPVRSMAEIQTLVDRFLEEKYEGAIARKDSKPYEYSYSGYHSPNLLKIKPVFDDEFTVVGFTQGSKGKDLGAIVWICAVSGGATFNVVPRDMTNDDRRRLFTCLSAQVAGADGKLVTRFERDLKGKPLTIEYRELSAKTGIPLQAKATVFRTYEGGPETDPVRKILDECFL